MSSDLVLHLFQHRPLLSGELWPLRLGQYFLYDVRPTLGKVCLDGRRPKDQRLAERLYFKLICSLLVFIILLLTFFLLSFFLPDLLVEPFPLFTTFFTSEEHTRALSSVFLSRGGMVERLLELYRLGFEVG